MDFKTKKNTSSKQITSTKSCISNHLNTSRKTKATQTWKITFHFANTTMRNDTLQPRAPLDFIHNTINNPQIDASIQLAVATCHLGSNCNGAAVLRLKNIFQVAYGTINLYTTQVIKAIYNMQS
ncbi:uncharacterized protein VP01_260g7 [Puccinia sorghi]|uniref:Uncharacterized protein n=1 Tax=Puccinia sorghi TaxID=27349 RepID=A0A0L6V6C9_9BASI|nr:uncharacterized protein VP01_260g7 [Puccinia sorghi]